jgi:hypothetical protein
MDLHHLLLAGLPAHSGSAPVIYLSTDGSADYRIFVHSKRVTAREAAALIVGARGGQRRLAGVAL